MAALVEAGLFRRDFPPGNGDHIGLEIDGGMAEFGVFRVRGEFHCDETRDANPRKLRYSEAELTMHTLKRGAFYALMAKDFGVAGQVVCLDQGIWELGRKNIPKLGRAKIIFAEQGLRGNDLVACLVRHGFKTNCLLYHGKPPTPISVPEKNVEASAVLVTDGRFVTEAFKDAAASRTESIPETGVDLDSTPHKLVICGEDFPMPLHQGNPLIGLKYIAVLFDRARECIPVWDLFVAAKPGLSDPGADGSNEGDEEDPTDTEQVSTGMKLSDNLQSIQPSWEDARMDPGTRKIVGQSGISRMRSPNSKITLMPDRVLAVGGELSSTVIGTKPVIPCAAASVL
ncbi:MAG: hypothetical protein NTV46_01310 [Verrucomicrobia bacterium]|nr:hypothetical protein [Verrucomicrobiota bacterium]